MCCSESQTKFWSFLLLGSIGALVAAVFVIGAAIGTYNEELKKANPDKDGLKATNDNVIALVTLVVSLGCAFCTYQANDCIGLLLGIATAILCILQAIAFSLYMGVFTLVSAACVALASSCANKCTAEACSAQGTGSVQTSSTGGKFWKFDVPQKLDQQSLYTTSSIVCYTAEQTVAMEGACDKLHLITTMLYVCFVALILATTSSISCAHICRVRKKSGGDDKDG